jgi:hypothetical protein
MQKELQEDRKVFQEGINNLSSEKEGKIKSSFSSYECFFANSLFCVGLLFLDLNFLSSVLFPA